MAKLRVDKIAAPIIEEEYTGSVHLPGTGNRVVASGFDSNLTGAFTIEGWYLASTLNADSIFFGNYNDTEPEEGLYLRYSNSDDEMYLFWRDADASSHIILRPGSVIFNTNQWHHVAVTRDSSDTVRIFLDGRSLGSVNNTDSAETVSMTDTNFAIGALNPGHANFWDGYVSNFRIVNGTALYTDDFEVPTSELKPVDGTVLLCCQSSTSVTEEASGGSTLTTTGSPVAVSDPNPGFFRKFNVSSTTTENTGSVFFDDSGDRLDIAIGTDLDLGTADFTIELWWYKADSGNNYAWTLGDAKLSTGLELYVGSTGTATNVYTNNAAQITAATNPSANEWHHYAVVRESGTLKLYIDGVQDPSTYDASSADFGGAGGFLYIGAEYYNSAFNYDGLKYISNFRVIKGKALYTSNFAVPTTELEVTPETVLVCCHDGENIFAEKTGKIIAAVGDRLSSPTPTATDSPIGITTFQPGLTRDVDPTAGPVFQGGAGFTSQNWLTLPKGTTTERFVEVANNAVSASSARGIFQGGQVPGNTNIIEYITIASAGNGIDFGDRTIARQYLASVASNTRGVTAGGDPSTNVIDYITISTLGDAQDFGDLFTGRYGMGSCASSIRGVWAGGTPGTVNTIDYVTIATTGDAKDFGDLTSGRVYLTGCGSPSRGLFAGGITPTRLNTIDFITIASMGNAFDFGDLTEVVGQRAGCSSSTRGVFGGGTTPTIVNTIDFVTISSTSNATDFGDITVTREAAGACSSSTRGVWGGGDSPTKRDTIDYVELATLGDATVTVVLDKYR